MHRKFKFRAWNIQQKKMDEVTSLCTWRHLVYVSKEELSWTYNDIVLMQYSELKDKNGVEIYEGDIVKSGLTGNKGQIVHTGYAFRVTPITGQWGGELRMFEFNDLEVIGNVFQHDYILRGWDKLED